MIKVYLHVLSTPLNHDDGVETEIGPWAILIVGAQYTACLTAFTVTGLSLVVSIDIFLGLLYQLVTAPL
jgi:hypothetical protein